METIYSLQELENMKVRTKRAIVEKLKEETAKGPKTAAELAKACGLCSTMHIANGVLGDWSNYYTIQRGEEVRVKRTRTYRRKTHHYAELDEQGNIIRRFDKDTVTKVCEYQF